MSAVKRWKLWAVMAVLTVAAFLYEGNMITARAEATATVTAGSAKIRSEASTSSSVVGSTTKGTKLPILKSVSASDGIWYQVTVEGNTTGYIRSDLVSTTGDVPAAEGSSTETPKPTVTNSEVRASDMTAGVVTGNSVNVRKGAATTDALAGTLKKDAVVKITGETDGADGKVWYQIESETVNGFIRSDLLEASAAVAEGGTEEETPEEGTEGTEAEQPEAPAEEDYTDIANVIATRKLPEGMDLESAGISPDVVQGWESDRYYIIYTQTKSGVEQWYLYDAQSNVYERINSLTPMTEEEIAAAEGGKGNTIVLVVLIVLIVALIGVIIYLALQLHDYKMDYEYDDDDDDEDDDEYYEGYEEGRVNSRAWKPKNFLGRDDYDDGYDEEDDEEEYRRPAKKAPAARGTASESQPVRQQPVRQQPARGEQSTPQRRPAGAARPEQGAGQRRPAGAARPEQGTPQRRPAGAGRPEQGAPQRRPAGAGRPEQGTPQRRPSGQPVRGEQGGAGRQTQRPNARPARPSYDAAEDEDFEFEFLNMNDEDYID